MEDIEREIQKTVEDLELMNKVQLEFKQLDNIAQDYFQSIQRETHQPHFIYQAITNLADEMAQGMSEFVVKIVSISLHNFMDRCRAQGGFPEEGEELIEFPIGLVRGYLEDTLTALGVAAYLYEGEMTTTRCEKEPIDD